MNKISLAITVLAIVAGTAMGLYGFVATQSAAAQFDTTNDASQSADQTGDATGGAGGTGGFSVLGSDQGGAGGRRGEAPEPDRLLGRDLREARLRRAEVRQLRGAAPAARRADAHLQLP